MFLSYKPNTDRPQQVVDYEIGNPYLYMQSSPFHFKIHPYNYLNKGS